SAPPINSWRKGLGHADAVQGFFVCAARVRRGRQNSPAERFITADGRGVPSLAAKQIGIPFLTNLSIAGHGFAARNLPPEQKPRCEAASRGFHRPSQLCFKPPCAVNREPGLRTPEHQKLGCAFSSKRLLSFHCPHSSFSFF